MSSIEGRFLSPFVVLAFVACTGGDDPVSRPDRPKSGFVATGDYESTEIEGWTVRINKRLNGDRAEDGREARKLLAAKLYEIRRVVPSRALVEIQKVPIWLGVDDGPAPCAEYHPSRNWLAEHGYNPDKALAVEIGCARRFIEWSVPQPSMVLHELAHAYRDRVLRGDDEAIRAAYQDAARSGKYSNVLRFNGKTESAYALTNVEEYFAEATEAYFGTNDFFPFVRAELKNHDPKGFEAVRNAWER